MDILPLSTIIRKNWKFILVLLFLSIAVYSNSLRNEFSVIDDLQGFVESTKVRDFIGSVKTLQLHPVYYALLYMFFGIDPLPHRIIAVLNHAVVSFLVFLTIYQLTNKKTAIISALLFVVHPVNSEAVVWISAQFYIVMSIFMFCCTLLYLAYRRTGQSVYLYSMTGLFGLYLLLFQHPFVLVTIMAIPVIDFFVLQRGFDSKFYKKLLYLIGPIILIYLIFSFPKSYTHRTEGQSIENGKIMLNEQALIPIIEGYPYSIYSIARLYLFPKDLTVYYDGNPVTTTTKIMMFTVFFMYIGLLIYFFRKNKSVFGFLLLPVVLVSPVFSPIKVTWYITERYLYMGTGYFTALLAILFIYSENRFKIKHLAFILTFIVISVYIPRLVLRNADWKNPETFAFATMKTSPLSIRPYNDVAGYYFLNDDIDKAKQYYLKALSITPSIVAMNNLGYIFLLHGLDQNIQTLTTMPPEEKIAQGRYFIEQKEYRQGLYYLNEAYWEDPENIEILQGIGVCYLEAGNDELAETYLRKAYDIDPSNPETVVLLGYAAYKQNDIPKAKAYLEQVLKVHPDHKTARDNLNYLNSLSPP